MSAFYAILLGSSTDVLPVIVGLFVYGKLGRDLKLFWLYFLFASLLNVRILYLQYYNLPNLVEFNIFGLTEYTLLVSVYALWQSSKLLRRALQGSIVVFLSTWVLLRLSGWSLVDLFFYFRIFASVTYVSLAAHLLHRLQTNEDIPIFSTYQFWFSTGILFYSATSVFFYALIAGFGVQDAMWVHSSLNIMANLFYAGGFYCLKRQPSI